MTVLRQDKPQRMVSFTVVLFTLSVGIVIGTLINSGVKAAQRSLPR